MKMTKRIAAMAMCGIMVATSMVGMSASAANTSSLNETENNNTTATADIAYSNSIMNGKISSSSDVDYYKFTATTTGYYDITLGVPTGCNYNFMIYNSSGTLTDTVAQNASGIGENYRKYFVKGNSYYIKVYTSSGYNANTNYSLYISSPVSANKTWYSQLNSAIDGHEWNNNSLKKLKSNYYSTIFIDDNYNTYDTMSGGCAITSIAMVLHNMDAKTSVAFTDFRTGFKGYMSADPFSVYLAHNNFTYAPTENDGTYTYKDKSLELRYYDENKTTKTKKVQNIGSYFNTNIVVHSGTLSDAKKELSSHPQGVIIRFNKNGKSHYVVMVASNNSDGFVIYDPGTQTASKGNGVSLSNSYVITNDDWDFTENDVTEYILIDKI